MGARISHLTAARCLLACALLTCTACGFGTVQAPAPATQSSAGVPTAVVTTEPSQPSVPPPYVAPDRELSEFAVRFVRLALSYDACAADRATSLDRVAPLVTPAELVRLHRSERAHLRWWVLCQRNERATVQVNGVSQDTGAGAKRVLHVEAVRTTWSDVSVARDFVDLRLTVGRTPGGWRVDGAGGGGL